MGTLQLSTERLHLTLQTVEATLARVASLPPDIKQHLSQSWLDLIEGPREPSPWIDGFEMTLAADETAVGECGYKGPPDSDGMVEIAYHTFPPHEGQGYATEAAAALVQYARGCPDVTVVRAHTLPEPNASTRVLSRCGFEKIGEVMDPDDGLVWRWETTAGC